MRVYEAIEKVEKENKTKLFLVILAYKDGRFMREYKDQDLNFLRNAIWEVANYEVLRISTATSSGVTLVLDK